MRSVLGAHFNRLFNGQTIQNIEWMNFTMGFYSGTGPRIQFPNERKSLKLNSVTTHLPASECECAPVSFEQQYQLDRNAKYLESRERISGDACYCCVCKPNEEWKLWSEWEGSGWYTADETGHRSLCGIFFFARVSHKSTFKYKQSTIRVSKLRTMLASIVYRIQWCMHPTILFHMSMYFSREYRINDL